MKKARFFRGVDASRMLVGGSAAAIAMALSAPAFAQDGSAPQGGDLGDELISAIKLGRSKGLKPAILTNYL